ncbi:hypothetical protein K439DRAFT_1640270 [Ramaria rubella]|nr:hypothetical protein K439DRAFT_1640270 [Ramaria rubella]
MDDFAVACAAALVNDTYLSLFDPRVMSESCDIETMSLDKPVSKLGMRPDSHRLSSKAHETAAPRKRPPHSKSLYTQRNAHEEFIPHVADLSVKRQVGAEANYVHSSHASVKTPSLRQVSFVKDLGLVQNLEAEAAHKNGQQRKNRDLEKRRYS